MVRFAKILLRLKNETLEFPSLDSFDEFRFELWTSYAHRKGQYLKAKAIQQRAVERRLGYELGLHPDTFCGISLAYGTVNRALSQLRKPSIMGLLLHWGTYVELEISLDQGHVTSTIVGDKIKGHVQFPVQELLLPNGANFNTSYNKVAVRKQLGKDPVLDWQFSGA